MEIVSSLPLHTWTLINIPSAKRMYFPKTYHHIQEIQKYNIQDYRPRYALLLSLSFWPRVRSTNAPPEWNNSKKPSARSGRCSACASSVATPSPRQTSRRRASCRPTTRPGSGGGTERWPARGQCGRVCSAVRTCFDLRIDSSSMSTYCTGGVGGEEVGS
jgi:hypothetical protein